MTICLNLPAIMRGKCECPQTLCVVLKVRKRRVLQAGPAIPAAARSSGPRRPQQRRRFPVAIAEGPHPIPFRTRSLSPPAPMVLGRERPGRVGHRRETIKTAGLNMGPAVAFSAVACGSGCRRGRIGAPGASAFAVGGLRSTVEHARSAGQKTCTCSGPPPFAR